MGKLILTVEDCFQLTRRGVLVVPPITPDSVGISTPGYKSEHGYKAEVRLVRPDGTEEIAEATFYWEHYNPGGYRYMCFLESGKKEQVPAGTEVWLEG